MLRPYIRRLAHWVAGRPGVGMVTVLLVLGSLPNCCEAATLTAHYRADTGPVLLRGREASQQLLATLKNDSGDSVDVTHRVHWSSKPQGVVSLDPRGQLTALANGEATVIARLTNGFSAEIKVTVSEVDRPRPINFANDIVPIFTKYGCNGGGCHGKAAGQNGFRLSLLGFEPAEDYDHLVKEARGRRLFPSAPEKSLLLQKADGMLPHGGGKRFESGSDDYRRLVDWISEGMPYGHATDPFVTRIEVFPRERILPVEGEQQLTVTAHYSDGSTQDVTRSALYEPNDKDMGRADGTGMVRVYTQPGDVAVMIRYQGKVDVFRATIPLGAPVTTVPPAKNFIDELVFAKLRRVGMPPSEICDDPTFVRRVTVDIAGRLPTAEEVNRFIANDSADKREHWIDTLLASNDYADYFANKWSALLRNKRNEPRQAHGTFVFHSWIRDQLRENVPFDRFVRQIVSASGDLADDPPVAWYRQVKNLNSQLEDTAQLFLGLRLQCAQCHHHPYERWSQKDYWSFGAFFSQVAYKPGARPGEEVVFAKRTAPKAKNKKNNEELSPAALGSKPMDLGPDDDARQSLSDWLVAVDNPFFARSLVNRYWKHFLGRGLVEPEDDMRETNPATNPELLDALSKHFVETGFDLKQLIRTITSSAVYQLNSTPNGPNAVDRHNFARFYPRRLNAEIVYDSVNSMLGSDSKFDGLPLGTRAVALPDNSFNASSYFLTVFGRPESSSACECERSMEASLSQSLHLLNSKELQEKLTADNGKASRLACEQSRSDEARLIELYLVAYARPPSAKELATALSYIDRKLNSKAKGADEKQKAADLVKARREAYEDLLWTLLNTKEFLFNH